jgi:hypothetical protein
MLGFILPLAILSLRYLVAAFVRLRTIAIGQEEFMSSGWLLCSSRGLTAEASSAMQWQGGVAGSFWSEDFGVSLLSLSSGRLLCSSRGLKVNQGISNAMAGRGTRQLLE